MKEGTGQFCPSFIITERGRGQFCRSFVSSSSLLCQVLEIKIQSQSDLRLHLLSQISPRYHHRQLNRHHFYRHHFYGAGWVLFVTSLGLFMSHSFTTPYTTTTDLQNVIVVLIMVIIFIHMVFTIFINFIKYLSQVQIVSKIHDSCQTMKALKWRNCKAYMYTGGNVRFAAEL